MRTYTWMLFAAVLLVQLIACVNVASMLLARGALRQAELGLRTAIGARRADIVRLVLCESLLLAAGATLLALFLASIGIDLVAATVPASEARKAAITLGSGEFAFIAALGVLTTLLAGLPVAFSSTRANLADLIRSDNRTATGSRTRHRLLRTLSWLPRSWSPSCSSPAPSSSPPATAISARPTSHSPPTMSPPPRWPCTASATPMRAPARASAV